MAIRRWHDTHIEGHVDRWRRDESGTPYVHSESSFTCDLCEDENPLEEIRAWISTIRSAYLCKPCAKRLGLIW